MSDTGKFRIWVSGDVRWMDQAACAGLSTEIVNRWFFSDEAFRGQEWKAAIKMCDGCVVREQCLAFVLDHPDSMPGVWGGTTENQRRRMKRDRKLSAAVVAAVTASGAVA